MSILIIPLALIIAVFMYRAISSGYQKKGHGKAISRLAAGLSATLIFIVLVVSFILLIPQPKIDSPEPDIASSVNSGVAEADTASSVNSEVAQADETVTNKPVKPLPLGGGYKGALDFS
jgi:preprotein translocase subunit YajC